MVAKGCGLLWIAAGYQLFDGLNISSGSCLRGAGDVRLPSVMVLDLSWTLFVPLAHILSFKPGAGWVDWLPQLGFGAVGGWFAALDLYLLPGNDAVSALALGRVAASGAAAQLNPCATLRRCIRERWISGVLVQIAFAVMLAASAAVAAPSGAPAPIMQTIAAERLPVSAVSFAIIDPDSGRVIASLNGETPRSPASTIKLVTTFASLDVLGPAYVWHTRALVRGELKNGVLDGDLILQGGGDPYMTLERWWSFVHMLRAKGLKSIRGDIVIDDTRVRPAAGGSGSVRRAAESLLQRASRTH